MCYIAGLHGHLYWTYIFWRVYDIRPLQIISPPSKTASDMVNLAEHFVT